MAVDGARIEWVTSEDRWRELREPWRRLAAAEPTPFAGPAWFSCWWDAFGRPARLRVCAAWEGDDLVAVLPMHGSRGRLAAMANYHTPTFRWPARDDEARRNLLREALAGAPSDLDLHALPRDEDWTADALAACRERGRVVLADPAHVSPIVDARLDQGLYMQERASRIRKLRRLRRKLEREHAASFSVGPGAGDLDAELARGFAVEAAGWKGARGTAIASSPATEGFYRAVAHAHRELGELRLAWLHVDNRPVAFSLCLQRADRLYLLKTGYDRAFRRDAPGLLLNFDLIERCFAGEAKVFELLGAEEDWKQTFATSSRAHVRVRSYRRRPIPLARCLARRHALPALRAAQARVRAARGGA
jgi:CelD/BcsL family acetyltransferase involved in cellulose biosynthesis